MQSGVRVLICGGRKFDQWRAAAAALTAIHAETPIALIISGGAPGADRIGEKWANNERLPLCVFPANWSHLGRKAGPIRNGWMIEFARPDLVVAFPGGPGTMDMIWQAERAGIEVRKPMGFITTDRAA